jgi:hypothetical protein
VEVSESRSASDFALTFFALFLDLSLALLSLIFTPSTIMTYTLTPEQQAVADERRAAREAIRAAKAAGLDQADEVETGVKVLKRNWIETRVDDEKGKEDKELDKKLGLKVISWNVSSYTRSSKSEPSSFRRFLHRL